MIMPIPNVLTDVTSYYPIGLQEQTFQNPNVHGTRQNITRIFHPYLETYFQSKHDFVVRYYLMRNAWSYRNEAGNQIIHGQGVTFEQAIANFYINRAATAIQIVERQLVTGWGTNRANVSVFPLGQHQYAAIQRILQPDGYRYELSYWYDGSDVYLSFHCY